MAWLLATTERLNTVACAHDVTISQVYRAFMTEPDLLPKLLGATASENVVLSHSWWGDGLYPVLGAYDSTGGPLQFISTCSSRNPKTASPCPT